MKKWLVVIMAILAISGAITLSCQQPKGAETVLIQGAVTIGPVIPVEVAGECPEVSPEVFSSRKLLIYDKSGRYLLREVYFTQIGNGNTGYYTAQIAPGTYVLDINRISIDTAQNLPQKITVSADETITVDIDIDTGIR